MDENPYKAPETKGASATKRQRRFMAIRDPLLLIGCVLMMVWCVVPDVHMPPFLFAAAVAISIAVKLAIQRWE